jgi:hypothetical protein
MSTLPRVGARPLEREWANDHAASYSTRLSEPGERAVRRYARVSHFLRPRRIARSTYRRIFGWPIG